MLRKQFNEGWTVSSNAGGSLVEAFLNGKRRKKVTLPPWWKRKGRLIQKRQPDGILSGEACTTMERNFCPKGGKMKRLSWSWKAPI